MVGIALEGGAVRCAFTAGVIDGLLQMGFVPDMAAGTSAGAGCILNLSATRQNNSIELLSVLSGSSSCFGLGQMLRTGHFVNLQQLSDKLISSTDAEGMLASSIHREFITACCEDGKPAYLTDNGQMQQLKRVIQASCALPIVCAPVEIGGKHYIDGSIVDPIPFSHLLEMGCTKVIAVLTGSKGCHPTDYTPYKPLFYPLYRKKYPALYQALLDRIPCYWEQIRQLEEAERQGKAYIFRPQIQAIPLFSHNQTHIHAYYQHGLELVKQAWPLIQAWLTEKKEKEPALCC